MAEVVILIPFKCSTCHSVVALSHCIDFCNKITALWQLKVVLGFWVPFSGSKYACKKPHNVRKPHSYKAYYEVCK